MKSVDILLATYNGEKYLPELFESIIKQEHQQWRLLIRDDGSTDSTPSIIEHYGELLPEKIFNVTANISFGNLGPKKGFGQLLQLSTAPYVMFCDQDDVWLPNKIALSLVRMLSLEDEHGAKTPILVHADLQVVDNDLQLISPSFWRYQRLRPWGITLNRLLMQNVVTGCAAMMNASLRGLVKGIPDEALMHDYWLSLVAVSLGVVDALDERPILYRQHSGNCVGAAGWRIGVLLRKSTELFKVRDKIADAQKQAEKLLTLYREQLPEKNKDVLDRFVSLGEHNWIGRRVELYRNGYLKSHWLRNLVLFIMV